MKIKFNPVQSIFAFYILLSGFLIFSYSSIQRSLGTIQVVDLSSLAIGLLVVSSLVLVLSLFSLFRIPIFHYLFKMLHLWIIVLGGLALYLYFKYGNSLNTIIGNVLLHKIVSIFPDTRPDIFKSFISLLHDVLKAMNTYVVIILMVATLLLAVVQTILYMPSSLRFVYYSHVSPVRYTLKHIVISLLLLTPLLFIAKLIFNHDVSLNPKLEQLLGNKPQTISTDNNIFYPMLSLWVPAVPDRIQYGKSWLSRFDTMLAYFRTHHTPVKPDEYAGYRKLLLGGMGKEDQSSINQLYVKRLQSDDHKLNNEIAVYIKKYQAELRLSRTFYDNKLYQNPVLGTTVSFTRFYKDYSGSFLSLFRLNLLALLVNNNDTSAVLNHIRKYYYFNLKIIKFSHDPNVKLLYINKQAVLTQFLYNLLDVSDFQSQKVYSLIGRIPLMSKPVISQDRIARDRLQAINNRLDTANNILSHSHSLSTNFIKYTYKYHKTLNCIYERAERKYNLDNQGIPAHISRDNVTLRKASLNNVIGNAICKSSLTDNLDDIFIRSVETNGKIMILKAYSKILEDKITVFNIGSFLNNHSSKYFNPFSGRPLKWNRDTKQIYFSYNNGNKGVVISY